MKKETWQSTSENKMIEANLGWHAELHLQFTNPVTSPVILSSALGDSRLFQRLGEDSKSTRSSGRSVCSSVFLFTNMNRGVKELFSRAVKPTLLLRFKKWRERILLPVVTLRILQPLQHIRDGWCGGWSCRYCGQIQAVFALLVKLADCRNLVTDGIFDRLKGRSKGDKTDGKYMSLKKSTKMSSVLPF